ncbi:MAG: hypothetical protein AAF658_08515 [Myxococcota bacterium]
MSVSQVRARWIAFLNKIEERHREVLREAEAGCLQLLDLSQLDTNPMANAWQGIRSQLLALSSKVDDTWSEKVEPAFEAAYAQEAAPGNHIDEYDRGRSLMDRLERDKLRAEIEIFAAAADRLMDAARSEREAEVQCTQCAATLTVDRNVFRSHYVRCEFCGVQNTYDPGTRVRAIENFCAQHLAKRSALSLELAMLDAWESVRAERTAPRSLLLELESAVKLYWSAFYEKRAEIVPDLGRDFDADLDARMREFYASMKHEKNWVP